MARPKMLDPLGGRWAEPREERPTAPSLRAGRGGPATVSTLPTPTPTRTPAPAPAADVPAAPAFRRHRRTTLAGSAVIAAFDALGVLTAMIATASWSTAALGYAVATLVVLAASGRWHLRISMHALEGAPRLFAKLAVPLLVVAPLAGSSGVPAVLVRQAVLTPLLVVLARCAAYEVVRGLRRRGALTEQAVIVGGGEIAGELARMLREHRELGVDVIGHLDAGPATLPVPKLGGVHELDGLVRRTKVSRVIVAFSSTREHELVEVLRTAVLHGLDVHVVPRFFDVAPGHRGTDVDEVWGIPLYRVRPTAALRAGWPVKRASDVAVAGLGLLITAPVLAAAALAVRLSGPGPILFRQRRIGQFGREIDVLKFRTMVVNAEADTRWGAEGDPRMTTAGRWLRRTNLDELPQLWNVLRGDMSLIGPRPERPYFVEQFGASIPGYPARHRVPAGLTGWAQVNGLRGDTSISERARFDNQYIEHWSLWRDLVILLRTVSAVLRKGSS